MSIHKIIIENFHLKYKIKQKIKRESIKLQIQNKQQKKITNQKTFYLSKELNSKVMNFQMNQQQQLSIADKLLQQLEDEYLAIQSQNILMPKQNIQPQDDPENPYQSLGQDFNDDQDEQDNQQFQYNYKNKFQNQLQNQQKTSHPQFEECNHKINEKEEKRDQYLNKNANIQCIQNSINEVHNQKACNIQSQLSQINLDEQNYVEQSNPQIKQQLIQVPPTNQQIYTNLPHKQFQIDQSKIKKFALQMQISQPQWLKDSCLCQKRIEQLFVKLKTSKPFKKI